MLLSLLYTLLRHFLLSCLFAFFRHYFSAYDIRYADTPIFSLRRHLRFYDIAILIIYIRFRRFRQRLRYRRRCCFFARLPPRLFSSSPLMPLLFSLLFIMFRFLLFRCCFHILLPLFS